MNRETDLIKERLDLVDFLRSYLRLLPAGKNFKALCPFHQEKTPSFIVSPERKLWHCFGCGAGGDLFGFVMRYENLEFPEALRLLAERAGLPLQGAAFTADKEQVTLYEINEVAKRFFRDELLKNKPALNYLKERGLKNETIEEFELGFAPGGDSLTLHLINAGYDVLDIVKAGLAHKNLKGLHQDRFGGRIIFPILSHIGKTAAFTGRLLNFGVASDAPKYLNSPETPIFVKSKILYGLSKSKSEIAKQRTVFLVEGQMDFLACWQSGVKNVVALSGTGLTTPHLERLRRLADTVILSFDNDEAGMRALDRSLDTFSGFDFHVKAIDLVNFKDPAEAVQAEPQFLAVALERARPALNRLFDYHFQPGLDIVSRKRLTRQMLLKLKKLKSRVEEDLWLKELSRVSGISETALLGEFQNLPAENNISPPVAGAAPVNGPLARIDLIASRLFSIAFANEKLFANLNSLGRWLPLRFRSFLENPRAAETALWELQSSYEFGERSAPELEHEFGELLKQLQIESLKEQMEELRSELRQVEAKGDESALAAVMVRFNHLAQKINELR